MAGRTRSNVSRASSTEPFALEASVGMTAGRPARRNERKANRESWAALGSSIPAIGCLPNSTGIDPDAWAFLPVGVTKSSRTEGTR